MFKKISFFTLVVLIAGSFMVPKSIASFFTLTAEEVINGVNLSFTPPEFSFDRPFTGFQIYRREFPSLTSVPSEPSQAFPDTSAKQVLMGNKMVPVMDVELTSRDVHSYLQELIVRPIGENQVLKNLYLFYGPYQLGEAIAPSGNTNVSWFLTGIDQIYIPEDGTSKISVYADLYDSSDQIPVTQNPMQLEIVGGKGKINVDEINLIVNPTDKFSEKLFPLHNILGMQISPDTVSGQRAAPIPGENLFAFTVSGQSAASGNVEAYMKKFRVNVSGNAIASDFTLVNLNNGQEIQGIIKSTDCHPGNGNTVIDFDLSNVTVPGNFVLSNNSLSYAIRAKVFSRGANGSVTSSLGFSIANLGNDNSDNFDNANATTSDIFWQDADLSINNVRNIFWIDQQTNSLSSSVTYLSEGDTGVSATCLAVAHAPSYLMADNGSTNAVFSKIASLELEQRSYLDTTVSNGVTYQYFVLAVDENGREKGRSNLVTATPVNVQPVTEEDTEEGTEENAGETTEETGEETGEQIGENEEENEEEEINLPFSDVKANDWFFSYIGELFQNGVIRGYSDNTFRPDQAVTRAEFLKMAFEMKGMDVSLEEGGSLSFSDVKENDWFSEYAKAAVKMGVIEGYTDNTFRPNQYITRAEGLKILFKIFGIDIRFDPAQVNVFQDIHSHWAENYILSAFTKDIISRAVFFEPDRSMNRAEAAKLIIMVSNYLKAQTQ